MDDERLNPRPERAGGRWGANSNGRPLPDLCDFWDSNVGASHHWIIRSSLSLSYRSYVHCERQPCFPVHPSTRIFSGVLSPLGKLKEWRGDDALETIVGNRHYSLLFFYLCLADWGGRDTPLLPVLLHRTPAGARPSLPAEHAIELNANVMGVGARLLSTPTLNFSSWPMGDKSPRLKFYGWTLIGLIFFISQSKDRFVESFFLVSCHYPAQLTRNRPQ